MKGNWTTAALGVFALASGPLALVAWNQGMGRDGFATPVGGAKWYATRPGFFETTGVRDPELSPLGTVFNWTNNEATLRFPRLARSKAALVTMRILRTASDTRTAPEVIFSVDGVEAERMPVPRAPKRVSVEIPRRAGRGAVVSIKVLDSTGVMLENVRLSSVKGSLPIPREAMGAMALVSVVWYVASLLAGAPPWIAFMVALVQATAISWMSVKGGAFLGRYSESIAWLAGIGFALSLVALQMRDLRWRRVWIATFCVAALKLSILSHPQLADSDAAFHAGNLRRVLSGDWFFTSATPPPAIPFPYPPGLSVAALPFSGLPQDRWVPILRGIVVVTETLATAAVSLAIAALSTEATGAMTFLFLAFSPEGLGVLFVGNLANLFADALLMLGCSFLITTRPVLASLALTGAFLSHFGTLLLGAPLSLLLVLHQGELLARVRRTAPILVALMAAFVLYYWRFLKVVTDAWDRMTYLQGAAAVGPMTAPATDKLARMGGGEGWWITAVVLVAMAIGMATWPRDRGPLARVLFTWLLVIAGFALLGLATPVQVRTGLSARPAVAALCASGVCVLWSRGRWGKGLAFLIVLLTAIGCWSIAVSFFPSRPV